MKEISLPCERMVVANIVKFYMITRLILLK